MKEFSESVNGDPLAVANHCTVEADDYFVRVITDPYEGNAQMHVSVAKKLIRVLERAVQHVETWGKP